MRPRSWLAVSAGTLTGSALAITGSPQSTSQADGDHRPPARAADPYQDPRTAVASGTRQSRDPFRPGTQ